ncbi:MarR family transcriptional regulator [Roseobacter sp. HKCCD9010]|uniref:MarR family winged helix-turn-helix transcriptional regulator n=2 Tax=unclassified Roseobacter TaxID=196798 RepID=UPI0014931CDC|nr:MULTISPECIES: MarR family transcriptional regulator [unclassified Roseobacter]MBF9049291.1 MarR family transcriptional regulator [Rhodobacterales bacterium HKCCD4356]NNW95319.1 MarR family transcriptional regulator [Roseobacter sp. HKCCD9159]NNX59203.1 MarR family transcriptional regulator [Roseobacter sp. HKCCD5938]NNX88982.1 MarR family transcriptional regulator [Roseobacter sp. HKCCD9056]NNY27724.1 MarR family transcriptional regulator [Roseobacter sp. HKCCD9199]NOB76443.1 MarR family t
MVFDKTDSAGYLANHMARLFARAIHARIKPLGLSPGNFPAMLELWARDGQTQSELVQRLDIEQATMANTLTRMERDGLITRTKDADDGRLQRIWLTERGKSLQNPATEAARSENARALQGLTAEEQDAFLALMRHVIQTLRDPSKTP